MVIAADENDHAKDGTLAVVQVENSVSSAVSLHQEKSDPLRRIYGSLQ